MNKGNQLTAKEDFAGLPSGGFAPNISDIINSTVFVYSFLLEAAKKS